jgi:hypothetical protein
VTEQFHLVDLRFFQFVQQCFESPTAKKFSQFFKPSRFGREIVELELTWKIVV